MCVSSAKGLARVEPSAAPATSVFRLCRPEASASAWVSAAVVLAAASSSLFSAPSLSTKSSKLLAFPVVESCFDFRLSSIILPLSSISCLAFHLRTTASGLSSSRVDASGEEDWKLDGGVISSPRLCRAMAILRRDESTHWRT